MSLGHSEVKPSCMVRMQNSVTLLVHRIYKLVHSRSKVGGNLNSKSFAHKQSTSKQWKFSIKSKKSLKSQDTPNSPRDNPPQFLDLPIQVREIIFSKLPPRAVLALRQTCSTLKSDIDSCRGVVFRFHESRHDYERTLKALGIEKLTVEQFIEDNSNGRSILAYPHLLKTLEISGSINPVNFRILLQTCINLTTLTITFHLPDQQLQLEPLLLSTLKVFQLSSYSFGTTESRLVANSIQDLLLKMRCPKLTSFLFHIVGFNPSRVQEYHLWAQNFLAKHSRSLKKLDIHLQQLMHPVILFDSFEDLRVMQEWTEMLTLDQLHLSCNSHAHLWYPIVDSQSCLKTLNVEVRNLSWSRLFFVLNKSCATLKTLVVSGLCLTVTHGIRTTPLDLGLLRNLENLEVLQLRHEDMESRGMYSPQVLRTSLLPSSLNCVKLANFSLKLHQCLFLLIKLPHVKTLQLDHWTGGEEALLAAFITVLTFLIKLEQTQAQSVLLTESRRRMENRSSEIERMKALLNGKAEVYEAHSELSSSLEIKRGSLYFY